MIMMKRYKKILLTGVLSALSCSFVHAQELYKNENAPVHERVMDLIYPKDIHWCGKVRR